MNFPIHRTIFSSAFTLIEDWALKKTSPCVEPYLQSSLLCKRSPEIGLLVVCKIGFYGNALLFPLWSNSLHKETPSLLHPRGLHLICSMRRLQTSDIAKQAENCNSNAETWWDERGVEYKKIYVQEKKPSRLKGENSLLEQLQSPLELESVELCQQRFWPCTCIS